MILNGPQLLLRPARAWSNMPAERARPATWLIAAAITAAVWPAIAVVAGHIGSAALGHVDAALAVRRAAVGLTSTIGGALVMAPALTLALVWTSGLSRGSASPSRAAPAAMGVVWPVWAAGIVLAVPPLLGLGPEPGELAWAALAALLGWRAIRSGAAPGLTIRRRWTRPFVTRSTMALVLLFVIITLLPAMTVRNLLGDQGADLPHTVPTAAYPLPPDPAW